MHNGKKQLIPVTRLMKVSVLSLKEEKQHYSLHVCSRWKPGPQGNNYGEPHQTQDHIPVAGGRDIKPRTTWQ